MVIPRLLSSDEHRQKNRLRFGSHGPAFTACKCDDATVKTQCVFTPRIQAPILLSSRAPKRRTKRCLLYFHGDLQFDLQCRIKIPNVDVRDCVREEAISILQLFAAR